MRFEGPDLVEIVGARRDALTQGMRQPIVPPVPPTERRSGVYDRVCRRFHGGLPSAQAAPQTAEPFPFRLRRLSPRQPTGAGHLAARLDRRSAPTGPVKVMAVYRAVWMNVSIIVGGLGVTIALSGDGALINAVVGMSVGVFTFLIQEARSQTGYRRQAVTAAAAATAGCAAVTGMFMLVGQGALVVAFLFAVTSPAAARGYIVLARRLTAWRRPSPQLHPLTTVLGETAPEGLCRRLTNEIRARELTDAELCQAWRTSSHALKKQGAPHPASPTRDYPAGVPGRT